MQELVMENTPYELHGNAAIEFAMTNLKEIRTDPNFWLIEFENPTTKEKWVMDYPQSALHGGGPPRLRRTDASQNN